MYASKSKKYKKEIDQVKRDILIQKLEYVIRELSGIIDNSSLIKRLIDIKEEIEIATKM